MELREELYDHLVLLARDPFLHVRFDGLHVLSHALYANARPRHIVYAIFLRVFCSFST